MRLHVLAGSLNLLRPDLVPAERSAEIIGPGIRVATAFWLSQRCGKFYHDFLLEDGTEEPGDRRLETFALSLRDNFGQRCAPLMVMPDLLGEAAISPAAESPAPADDIDDSARDHSCHRALGTLLAIWQMASAERLVLHALALPGQVDADGSWAGEMLKPRMHARLDALRAALGARGIDNGLVETRVTEIRPEMPEFDRILRNALANRIVPKVRDRLAGAGLGSEFTHLRSAIVGILQGWEHSGILPFRDPVPALGQAALDRLSERIGEQLFANAPAATGVSNVSLNA